MNELNEKNEISIVIPCLNEAETLGVCIRKAQRVMCQHNISGEIIVADNGSRDGSPEIAAELGARVEHVANKGYGSALMGGIRASTGKYILMGDADDSYDYLEIPKFLDKLRTGYDLVQGCRFPSGGGEIKPGAMPFMHRWLGNPLFSLLARKWFKAPINDIYCGMRAFTKQLYDRLNLRCTGMEFATEMIIKASQSDANIAEVPITLHPDGRKTNTPHLRTFIDGWRTLRLFLLFSPKWLFLVPGALLVLFGLIGYAIALPGFSIKGVAFDAHTLLFASLFVICGYQSIVFAILAKTFAITSKLRAEDLYYLCFFRIINLERGLIAGALSILIGFALLAAAINEWRVRNFGPLIYAHTMRLVIPGVTLVTLGFQTILSGFFVSIIGMGRR